MTEGFDSALLQGTELELRDERLDRKLRKVVMVSLAEFVVWIIIGLLGGSLVGLIITRERKGFGFFRNLALGLVGALVGGLLFRLLRLFPALDRVAISLRDIVAAVVGSLLVLGACWLFQRFYRSPRNKGL